MPVRDLERPVFITWRLSEGLWSPSPLAAASPTLDQAASCDPDKIGDECGASALPLCQSAVADMIVEAIRHNATQLGDYVLHAFVVMPDHVHLLVTPTLELSILAACLRGITTKRAKAMLAMGVRPFWQADDHDYQVKEDWEIEQLRASIEENPVRAQLVKHSSEYRWSSAGWSTGRAARGIADPRYHDRLRASPKKRAPGCDTPQVIKTTGLSKVRL